MCLDARRYNVSCWVLENRGAGVLDCCLVWIECAWSFGILLSLDCIRPTRVEYDACVNSENELLVGVHRSCSRMRS